MLGSHTDADDAWSETFLAALRAYPGLPPGANTQAWLITIARRKAIDVTRARARHAVPVATLPEPLAAHPPDPTDTSVWCAVATLPALTHAAQPALTHANAPGRADAAAR